MPDFDLILKEAQEQARFGGYTGYAGYTSKKASSQSSLPGGSSVTTVVSPLVTVVTKDPSDAVHVENVTSVTTITSGMVTQVNAEFIKQDQIVEVDVTTVTTVTIEKHDFLTNSAVCLTDLCNSLDPYESQADPNRCHVCGERETAAALFIAVLTSRPGEHHWIHHTCHPEHIRRCAERRNA